MRTFSAHGLNLEPNLEERPSKRSFTDQNKAFLVEACLHEEDIEPERKKLIKDGFYFFQFIKKFKPIEIVA